MKPGDRLICAFVEPQAIGRQFKEWLLHVTIIPWFRLDDESEQIALGLQKALTPLKPFSVGITGQAGLGPRKRPAHLLEPGDFHEVEKRARNYLHKKRAWLVDETTKKPRRFLPHVTYQGDTRLHEDSKVVCERIYIVEQKGGYKEVVGVAELHS